MDPTGNPLQPFTPQPDRLRVPTPSRLPMASAEAPAATPQATPPGFDIADPLAQARDIAGSAQAQAAQGIGADPLKDAREYSQGVYGRIQAQQEAQPWLEGIPATALRAVNRAIAESPDPEGTAWRIGTAAQFSRILKIPLQEALDNLEPISQALTAKPYMPKTTARAAKDQWDAGWTSLQLGKLALDWQATGGTDKALEAQLDALQAKIDTLSEDAINRPWYQDALKGVAGSMPYMIQTTIAGAGIAAGVGLGAAALGAEIGTGGLGTPVTVAAAAGAAFIVGSAAETFQISDGLAYYRLRKQGHTHNLSAGLAASEGAVQAAIESLIGYVPGAQWLTGSPADDILTKAITKRITQAGVIPSMGTAVAKWGTRTLSEAAEEYWQEWDQIATDAIAQALEDVGYETPAFKEAAGRAGKAFVSSLATAAIFGAGDTYKEFRGDVQAASAVKAAADRAIAAGLDFKAFSRDMEDTYANMRLQGATPVMDQWDEATRAKITKSLWDKAQKQAAAERAAQEKATNLPDIAEEEGRGKPNRIDGKLYTQDRTVYSGEDGEIKGIFKLGDPEAKGNRAPLLAHIGYTKDADAVSIDRISWGKISKDTRREFLIDFMESHAGEKIEWKPKTEEDQALYDELVQDNPRGPEFGLQWYNDRGQIERVRSQEQAARQLRTFVGKTKLRAEQVPVLSASFSTMAADVGMGVDEFIQTVFSDQGFTMDPELAASVSGQALEKFQQDNRGATAFERMNNAHRAIIYMAEKADATTFFHEIAHAYQTAIIRNRALNEKFAAKAAEIEKAFGVVDGNWDAEATGVWAEKWAETARARGYNLSFREAFSYGFEEYLRTGKAPTPEQQTIFQKIAEWFFEIYNAIAPRVKLNADIVRVYEGMMGGTGPIAELAARREAPTDQTAVPAEALYQPSAEEIAQARAEEAEVRARYEGTDAWMKAPNGQPTKLTEHQWLQVRTPSFKAWFGDWETKQLSTDDIMELQDKGTRNIYIRWSRGPEHDTKPSRDFVKGEDHIGLSAVWIDYWEKPIMERRLKEYEFLRIKDSLLKPYIYQAEEIGKDSDGYSLIPVGSKLVGVWDEGKPNSVSKVVDENGEPMVVYHGTVHGEFDKFRTTNSEMGAHFGTIEQATSMAIGYDEDETRVDGNIFPVFLNIKSPIRLQDLGQFTWERVQEGITSQGLMEDFAYSEENLTTIEIQNNLKAEGVDGVIYLNRREGVDTTGPDGVSREVLDQMSDEEVRDMFPAASDSYIVFSPTQIKSATGNAGTFNASDPSILYQPLDEVDQKSFSAKIARAIGAKSDGRGEIDERGRGSRYYRLADGRRLRISNHGIYNERSVSDIGIDIDADDEIISVKILDKDQSLVAAAYYELSTASNNPMLTYTGERIPTFKSYNGDTEKAAADVIAILRHHAADQNARPLDLETMKPMPAPVVQDSLSAALPSDAIVLNQPAFHGSPYRFKAFSTDRIGSGAGEQRYGWGLYFASKKEIADTYRAAPGQKKQGPLYAVEIPDDSDFLFWSKPLSESSKKVQAGVKKALKRLGLADILTDDDPSGGKIYERIVEAMGSQEQASRALMAAGVQGTAYPDGTARSRKDASYNYVVFDDSQVEIEEVLAQHTEEELAAEAKTFDSWQEFKEYSESLFLDADDLFTEGMTPEQIDDFYRTVWEKAKAPEKWTADKTAAANRDFSDSIKTDAGLRSYLMDLYMTSLDFGFMRAVARGEVESQEEYELADKMVKNEIIVNRKASPVVKNAAVAMYTGKATAKILNSARGVIQNNLTEYRRLIAEVKGEQLADEESATPYIQDPRWAREAELLSIEKRRRLARTIGNDEIARKIARGQITVDDPELKEHLAFLTAQVKEGRAEIAKAEAKAAALDDNLSDTQRSALKLQNELKDYQKRLTLVEKRAAAFLERQAELPAATKQERDRLQRQIAATEAAFARARIDAKSDAAYLDALSASVALRKEKARVSKLEAERRAAAQVRAEMQRLADRATKPFGKKPRIDLKYRRKIEELTKQLDPRFRSKKTLEKLEHWRDFLNADPANRGMMDQDLIRRVQAKPLNEWDLNELRDFTAQIDLLREQGRQIWREKDNMKQTRRNTAASSMIDAALAGKDFRRAVGAPKPSKIWTKVKLATLRPLAILLELDGGKRGIFTQWLWDKYNEAWAETERQKDRRYKIMDAKLKEYGFTLDPLGGKGKQYVGDSITVLDENGREFIQDNGRKLTVQNAIYFYIGMKNEQTREAILYGNNIPEAVVKNAIEGMTENQRKLADAISEDYADNFSRFTEAFESQYNAELPGVEFYIPMRRLDTTYDTRGDEIAASLAASSRYSKKFTWKGNTNHRIENINAEYQMPIRLDAVTLWHESVAKEEAFIAQDWLVHDLQAIVTRPNVLRAIQQRMGPEAVRWVKKYLNDLAMGTPEQSVMTGADRWMQAIRGKLAISYLSFNVLSGLKQLVSPLPYLADAGPARLLSAAGKYLAAKATAIKGKRLIGNDFIDFVEERSEMIKHRSISRDFEDAKRMALSDTASDTLRKLEALEKKIAGNIGMKHLEIIDKVSVCIGWRAVYDKAKAEGKSEEEAIRDADDSTAMTQPSGRVQDLAEIYRGGEFLKFATMFTNALNAQWNMMVFRIPNAIRQKQYAKAVGDAVALALCGLGIALVSGALYGDDDEEKKKKLAFGMASQYMDSIPIVGSFASMGLKAAMHMSYFNEAGVNPFPAGEKFVYAIGAVSKGDFDRALAQTTEGLAYAMGLPVVGGKRAVDAIVERNPALLIGWKNKEGKK